MKITKTKKTKRSPKIEQARSRAKQQRWDGKETKEIVLAIRRGKVDALVIDRGNGNQVLTLEGTDHPFRILVERINEGAATLDSSGTVLYANSRFIEILGVASENFIGSSLQSHLSPSNQEALENLIDKGIHGSVKKKITLATANGRPRLVQFALHPIKNSNQKNICVVATELTELVEAHEAIRSNEKSLRQLSARLLKLQDEERRYIARDLHDITGQKLAVQSMTLAQFLKAEPNLAAGSRQMLTECVNLNKMVSGEIRTLSYLLHPPLLDELGLASAVKWFAEGFEHKTGIRLNVDLTSRFTEAAASRRSGSVSRYPGKSY